MIAAGAYLRALREGQGLSAEDVAAKMTAMLKPVSGDPKPVSASTIWRIEEGEGRVGPTGYRLNAYLIIVNGLIDHLNKLMFDPAATAAEGERLARQHLTREEVVQAFAPTPNETPRDRARINRLIDLLATGIDPQEAARIVKSEE